MVSNRFRHTGSIILTPSQAESKQQLKISLFFANCVSWQWESSEPSCKLGGIVRLGLEVTGTLTLISYPFITYTMYEFSV